MRARAPHGRAPEQTDCRDLRETPLRLDAAHAAIRCVHAHGPEVDVETVAELALNPKDVLLPQMNICEAASLFETSKNEELAVVDDRSTLKVVGLLTKQYELRRYNAELDSRSRDTASV